MLELKLNGVAVGFVVEEVTSVLISVTGAGATAIPDRALEMLATGLRLQTGACDVFQLQSVPWLFPEVTR